MLLVQLYCSHGRLTRICGTRTDVFSCRRKRAPFNQLKKQLPLEIEIDGIMRYAQHSYFDIIAVILSVAIHGTCRGLESAWPSKNVPFHSLLSSSPAPCCFVLRRQFGCPSNPCIESGRLRQHVIRSLCTTYRVLRTHACLFTAVLLAHLGGVKQAHRRNWQGKRYSCRTVRLVQYEYGVRRTAIYPDCDNNLSSR